MHRFGFDSLAVDALKRIELHNRGSRQYRINLIQQWINKLVKGAVYEVMIVFLLVKTHNPSFFFLSPKSCLRFVLQQRPDILTTGGGHPIGDKLNLQTAGPKGPLLVQDVVFTDEMAHFDRERIPERVVHAKGAGECWRVASTFSLEVILIIKYIFGSCARLRF